MRKVSYAAALLAAAVATACSGSSSPGPTPSSASGSASASASGSGGAVTLDFETGSSAAGDAIKSDTKNGLIQVSDGVLDMQVRQVSATGNFQGLNAIFGSDELGGSGTYGDVTVSTDVSRVDSSDPAAASYGVLCRAQDNQHYYYFAIGSDGFYTIKRVGGPGSTEAEPVELASGTDTSAISTGASQTNTVSASCVGDALTLRVNGTEVAHATDSTYTDGQVGLALLGKEGVDVQYDSVTVTPS